MAIVQPRPARSRSVLVWVTNILLLAIGLCLASQPASAAIGDAAEGARLFGACAACHALEPGRHRTGPSLAGIVGRRAGRAAGFRRYSAALVGSGVIWDEAALDAWIRDPAGFIPGNRMTFPGVADDQARADLIAYLEQAASADAAQRQQGQGGMSGGMMGGGQPADLKTAGPANRVSGIRRCGDSYEVTTADGAVEPFWEFNLRFKTDGSERGPEPGKPVIVGAGMMGDRASVVFGSPKEISAFIQDGCPN